MSLPALSILVPVYNEEQTLTMLMNALVQACPNAQIIYIDDGSMDASYDILKHESRAQDIIVTKKNGGKGSAIRAGLEKATGTFVMIQDADLEYDPKQINELLSRATDQHSVIFGSRFLQPNPNIYKRYLLGNKAITWFLNMLFRSHITDSYTCYKLLPTDLMRSLALESNGFEMEAEICAKCLKRSIVIAEYPISYKPRSIEEGKKIGWKDGWKALSTMLRIRFAR